MTSTSSDSPKLGPVQAQERIVLLDVLRAVAILGMFYSNWGGTYHPDLRDLDHGVLQETVSFLRGWFIFQHFYPFFALLMGVGMGIQMERALERGRNIVPVYLRRLLFLFLLGWLGSFFLSVHQLEYLAVAGITTFFIGYVFRRHRTLLLVVIGWLFLTLTVPSAVRRYGPEYREFMAEAAERRVQRQEEFRQRNIERFEEREREAVSLSSPFHDGDVIQRRVQRELRNPIPGAFSWCPSCLVRQTCSGMKW